MTDHTFKKLFVEAKRQDASNTPSFQRMLRKQAHSAEDPHTWTWMPFATAAAFLFAAAIFPFSVFPKNENYSEAEIEQWSVISDWTASSDAIVTEKNFSMEFTLSIPSDQLFESAPISSNPNKNQNL